MTTEWWRALALPPERYQRARFFVVGRPGPKGSFTATIGKRAQDAIETADREHKRAAQPSAVVDGEPVAHRMLGTLLDAVRDLKPIVFPVTGKTASAWQKAVKEAAAIEAKRIGWRIPAHDIAVAVEVVHYFERPDNQYLRGQVRPLAPLCHRKDPDNDKVLRTTLDGLTPSFLADDNVVVSVLSQKRWGDAETRRILCEEEQGERYGAMITIQEVPASLEEYAETAGTQRSLAL